jgi:glycopeptide antibiotics resistance protein
MILISTGSEVAQGLISSSRRFDPKDIMYNMIGSSLGIVICILFEKLRSQNETPYIPLQELV